MVNELSSKLNNNKQTWYQGKLVDVKKDIKGFYAIVEGKRVNLNDAILSFQSKVTEVPEHFVNYYDKLMKKYEQERKELKLANDTISDKIKSFTNMYTKLLSKYNAKKFSDLMGEQRTEALHLLSETFGLKRQKNRIGMAFMSACMSGFDAALQKGNWNNMLALAKNLFQ